MGIIKVGKKYVWSRTHARILDKDRSQTEAKDKRNWLVIESRVETCLSTHHDKENHTARRPELIKEHATLTLLVNHCDDQVLSQQGLDEFLERTRAKDVFLCVQRNRGIDGRRDSPIEGGFSWHQKVGFPSVVRRRVVTREWFCPSLNLFLSASKPEEASGVY